MKKTIYDLTNFAALAKHHFTKNEDLPMGVVDQTRYALALDGYDLEHCCKRQVARFLLNKLQSVDDFWATPIRLIEGIAPENCWKHGYYTNENPVGRTPMGKYDMYTAIIHYIKSEIANCNANLFSPDLMKNYKNSCTRTYLTLPLQ